MSRPLILVVDDDAPILLLMRNLLREFGFEPLAVASGPEAIEQARQRTPDLVLLDWNMPGMSGDEVLRTMRAEPALASVPVLILSGTPMESQELRAVGATGAVMKPFDVMKLVDTIRKHVA
ncbi:MAG TPA: response regulator [Thermoanaerobaculia bacterium]|nr:response regulator [Thermoanaerobaculia bacterium]